MFVRQRITIIRMRHPQKQPLNDELQFFGKAVGLFGERDRDKSCFRIFIELLKSTRFGGLSSDDIAIRLNLTRGTVVHHLNTLIEKGIVIHEGNKYVMRADNLTNLIATLRNDMLSSFDELERTAQQLDKYLQLR